MVRAREPYFGTTGWKSEAAAGGLFQGSAEVNIHCRNDVSSYLGEGYPLARL